MKCEVLFQVRDEDGRLLISKDAVIPDYKTLDLLSAIAREDEENDDEIIVHRDHIGSKDRNLFDEDENNFLKCCNSAEQAIEEFRNAFPDSDKNNESIRLEWSNLKNQGLLKSLKTGHYVKITDAGFPQYDTIGRVLQVKGDDVLVSFAHSAVWIDKSILEVVDSPSKK